MKRLCKTDLRVIENGYLYDDNGNRVSSNLHGANYVTGAGNRLQSDGVYNYEYDDEGNLVKRTEIATGNYRELAYDFRNRLVLVTERDSAAQELSFTSYLYDALDRRIAKQVDLNPADGIEAPALLFVYDGANLRLEFLDSDGIGGASLPVLATRYFNGPGIDNVIAVEHYAGSPFNAGAFWLGKDHLGSTRQVLSASGEVNRIHYDSFGNVASQTNAAFGSRIMYTGRELDAETGLYYYRARYYDASIGRFLQEDPIGFAGGMNLYSYVGNNPLMYRDPFVLQGLVTGNYISNPAFAAAAEANLRRVINSLPVPLRQAELGQSIYLTESASQVPGLAVPYGVIGSQQAGQIGRHFSGTSAGVQYFSMWSYYNKRWNYFDKSHNFQGTVAHEAWHALASKLGYQAGADPGFIAAFNRDLARHNSQGICGIYDSSFDPDEPSILDELFAELGAAAITGQTSLNIYSAQGLTSDYSESYNYLVSQINAGTFGSF